MAPKTDPNINPVIWKAIEQKHLLRFRHKNRERIVEPHDYGIHKGVIKLYLFTGSEPNHVRCCPGADARALASG
jgi:hypothetical protein